MEPGVAIVQAAHNLDVLRRALANLPDGPIPAREQTRITDLLAAAWDELQGSDAEGMTAAKIRGRIEDLTWQPPCLSFTIERHGGTVLGSTRAELHRWEVNVATGEAAVVATSRFRQVAPRARPVPVGPLVAEVAHAIKHHQEHPAVAWLSRTRVRVIASRVEGLRSPFEQTAAGRRRRFGAVLDQQLAPLGWLRRPVPNRFEYEQVTTKGE
jgi:hypothetical protein